MKAKKSAFPEKQNILLLSILFFSLLLFFFAIRVVPQTYSEGRELLLGAALILALCMPSFFFLRSAEGEALSFLGDAPALRTLPLLLLFSLGAFSLGAFLAENLIVGGSSLLFSRIAVSLTFVPATLATVIVYAFTLAFVPFGVLYSCLAQKGTVAALLASSLFFAALSFSLDSLPYFLLFGLFLGLLRWQNGSFLAPLLGMLFFAFGGYAVVIGALAPKNLANMSHDDFLLWTGIFAALFLLLSQSIRFWRSLREHFVPQNKKTILIWIPFAIFALGVSVVLTILF